MAFMFIFTLICMLCFNPLASETLSSNLQTYIVHVESPRSQIFTQSFDLENWYQSSLPATTASRDEPSRIVHSYRNVVSGFAARLTPEEAEDMEKKDGFLTARPVPLQTTHSPNFLGLHQNFGFWKDSNFGEGVIIGVLDTGIMPNHPSFSDEGMPPPPVKWNWKCEFNGIICNDKLIGTRSFLTGETTLDTNGHGTHTASTAAGNFVNGANVFGNANGTAVGIAPHAHLAIYKVCSGGCSESAILAAMDTAVEDGVDILSISLGGVYSTYDTDTIAVGAFGAMQKGVFVSCSAGNRGPLGPSLSNEAQWVLTVGATTIDRSIRATTKLGNSQEFDGQTLFQPGNFSQELLPLVFPGVLGDSSAALCGRGAFNNIDIKGKIVVCESNDGSKISQGKNVKNAGGAGMILINTINEAYCTFAEAHVLPATQVSYDGVKIKAYKNSTTNPEATLLFKGTIIGANYAPMIASFSSRGPSQKSPGILKPDIIGPGVNILAAWPISVENRTNTNSTFNIISGTSMACPQLSGIAASLRKAHPDWSPAAIKSAIITTADQLNLDNKPIFDQNLLPADIFATGAGHVNPSRANNPGLVYDIQPDDYMPYLCGLNYTSQQIGVIAQRKVNCSAQSSIPEAQLNYPSLAIILGTSNQTYTRTVTNVGEANSSYTVDITPPKGVLVTVSPNRLEFSEINQKLTYQVTFGRSPTGSIAVSGQGFLRWTSAKHVVTSPISVRTYVTISN